MVKQCRDRARATVAAVVEVVKADTKVDAADAAVATEMITYKEETSQDIKRHKLRQKL